MSIPTVAAVLKGTTPAHEAIGGAPEQEIEYTFYGKLKSLEQLSNAKEVEEHEQWQVPLANRDCGVRQRIREINGIRWVLTTKTTIPGKLGVEEIEADITQAMFGRYRQAGKNGYRKTRYNFPIFGTNRKWEVDVFITPQGERSLWVKIDLEVDGQATPIPDFPFELEDVIIRQEHEQTVTESNLIKDLWREEWCSLDETAE